MEHINPLTQAPVSDDQLQSIADLAKIQIQKESQIEELELKLADLKEELKKVSEVLIPEAMMAVGMSDFTLKDGTYVGVSKYYSASIPKDKTNEAFAWLRTNQFGEIIKREIKSKFGKGEDERATELAMTLARMKINFEDKESVHPQTLKAFVKEQIESGTSIPMDLLGVYIGNRSKITPATK